MKRIHTKGDDRNETNSTRSTHEGGWCHCCGVAAILLPAGRLWAGEDGDNDRCPGHDGKPSRGREYLPWNGPDCGREELETGTQLDATEDPQMETISYGEGTDYLVVIYQEGKVISLGTYWEDLEDLTANTQDQDSKWQTTEGIARGAALEDLQKAYPDGKYLAKNSSPEDGNQPSQNLFQTKGTTGGLTFVLTDEGVVKTINLITLDYFANDVGLQ